MHTHVLNLLLFSRPIAELPLILSFTWTTYFPVLTAMQFGVSDSVHVAHCSHSILLYLKILRHQVSQNDGFSSRSIIDPGRRIEL